MLNRPSVSVRKSLASILLAGLAASACVAEPAPPETTIDWGTTTTPTTQPASTTTSTPATTTTAAPVTTTTAPVTTTTAPVTTTTTPTQPATGIREVVSGEVHSCALLQNATVRCWGNNSFGQLGVGDTNARTGAVTVGGLSDVKAIAAGAFHTCAVLNSGGTRCWGNNSSGQLGDGSYQAASVPVAPFWAVPQSDAVGVAAGDNHSCVLRSTGQASCWGDNYSGQLGTGANFSAPTPRSVALFTLGTSITAGANHTCATRSNGTTQCWGDNSNGQLGIGTKTSSNVPATVSSLSNAVSVSAGAAFTCAITSTNTVSCWGENTYGQLGNGAPLPPTNPQQGDPPPPDTTSTVPVAVLNVTNARSLSSGPDQACARVGAAGSGTVQCWGRNTSGELGDNTTTTRSTSAAVNNLSNAVLVSAGGGFSCASVGATVQCWGSNVSSQLGSAGANSLVPRTVTGL